MMAAHANLNVIFSDTPKKDFSRDGPLLIEISSNFFRILRLTKGERLFSFRLVFTEYCTFYYIRLRSSTALRNNSLTIHTVTGNTISNHTCQNHRPTEMLRHVSRVRSLSTQLDRQLIQ